MDKPHSADCVIMRLLQTLGVYALLATSASNMAAVEAEIGKLQYGVLPAAAHGVLAAIKASQDMHDGHEPLGREAC